MKTVRELYGHTLYLFSFDLKLICYVVFLQLFSRITKLGWYDVIKDEYVFRNVVTDVGKFIQSGSTQHVMIGVQLLSQLVVEMNRVTEVNYL